LGITIAIEIAIAIAGYNIPLAMYQQ